MSPPSEVTVLDASLPMQMKKYVDDDPDGNPLWCTAFLVTHPEEIKKSYLDFLRVGAEVVVAATYQASIDGFMKYLNLSEEESLLLIKKAVMLAREACEIFNKENELHANTEAKRPLVVGSVGPYGACLHDYSEYTGEYIETVSQEELKKWHRPRIQALVEAGVDLLALETIPAQAEAEALIQLLKEFPDQKAWLSFSCKDEFHTSHGEKFQECVRYCWQLNPTQLVAIGVNCCNPHLITPLFKGINNDGKLIPLIAYPSSGEKFVKEKGWIKEETCPPISTFVREWIDLGVKYIGGCCRTNIEDISKIKSEVTQLLKTDN